MWRRAWLGSSRHWLAAMDTSRAKSEKKEQGRCPARRDPL
jgi:hypothetical protein